MFSKGCFLCLIAACKITVPKVLRGASSRCVVAMEEKTETVVVTIEDEATAVMVMAVVVGDARKAKSTLGLM